MGRMWSHKPPKTYSKQSVCVDTKEEKLKRKQAVRKPLPKFENLFINKKEDDLFLTSPKINKITINPRSRPINRSPDLFKSDSSVDFISSGNDTFDAITKIPIREKENIVKKKNVQNLSDKSSSSESSQNELFLSALQSTTSKVSGLFISTPLKSSAKTEEGMTHKTKPAQSKKNVFSSHRKETTPLTPLCNVITSTPTYRPVDGSLFKKRGVLNNDFSPVAKDSSFVFEMSSYVEPGSVFLSCDIDQGSGSPILYTPQVRSGSQHSGTESSSSSVPSLRECYMSVKRVDPTLSGPSPPNILDETELRKFNVIFSFQKPGNTFHQVPRRRRAMVQNFKARRSKRGSRVSRLLSSSSVCCGNKSQSILGVNSSVAGLKHKSSSILCVNSSAAGLKHKSSFAYSSFLDGSGTHATPTTWNMSLCKAGKGWRRSLRKFSNVKKVQSSFKISILNAEESVEDVSLSRSDEGSSVFEVKDEVKGDPRSYVLGLCGQVDEVPLADCFDSRLLSDCKKIGEGLYGEVFMSSRRPTVDSTSSLSANAGHNDDHDKTEEGITSSRSVLKVMPIEGDFEVNGEPQKKFSEIAAEIVVSKTLSDLSDESRDNFTTCFVSLKDCWCAKGAYPPKLLQLWDEYAEKKESENDRPDVFPASQIHLILEFGFAGQDLESFVFNNATQAHAAFLQITCALAVAESAFGFEHRDLHWGNVLLAATPQDKMDFTVKANPVRLKTLGVHCTIIDFTLSRLLVGGKVYFNDLSTDPSLFTAHGDYQFEVYRKMKEVNGDDWEAFEPSTNIFWLHYLVLKLMHDCYYKNVKTKVHREGLKKLAAIEKTLLQYTSAMQLISHLENFEL